MNVMDADSRAYKRKLSILTIAVLVSSAVTVASRDATEMTDFSDFPAAEVHGGAPAIPDFENRDKEFASFRTRILEGLRAGPNFAGSYSVVQFGCGTGCLKVVVANTRTGKVHRFPRGGELNQGLEIQYVIDSKLLLARWYTDSLWETCVYEALVFDDGDWVSKASVATGPSDGSDRCDGSISNALEKKLH
jgi:hypothetical protein